MSETVSVTFTDMDGDRTTIKTGYPAENGALVKVLGPGGAYITKEEAPAAALAILKAAGYDPEAIRPGDTDALGHGILSLAKHIREQEEATAKAKEEAELDAKALAAWNAYREACGFHARDSFDSPSAGEAWRDVVRTLATPAE